MSISPARATPTHGYPPAAGRTIYRPLTRSIMAPAVNIAGACWRSPIHNPTCSTVRARRNWRHPLSHGEAREQCDQPEQMDEQRDAPERHRRAHQPSERWRVDGPAWWNGMRVCIGASGAPSGLDGGDPSTDPGRRSRSDPPDRKTSRSDGYKVKLLLSETIQTRYTTSDDETQAFSYGLQ